MEKTWEQLEHQATSKRLADRRDAVVRSHAKVGRILKGIPRWGEGVRKAVNFRAAVVHNERNPTVEEALNAVRVFFKLWQDKKPSDEKCSLPDPNTIGLESRVKTERVTIGTSRRVIIIRREGPEEENPLLAADRELGTSRRVITKREEPDEEDPFAAANQEPWEQRRRVTRRSEEPEEENPSVAADRESVTSRRVIIRRRGQQLETRFYGRK